MASIDTIRGILETALSPLTLDILDESHAHQGHYHSDSADPSHLKIRIVSAAFDGLSRVKQHQLVNRVLKPAFDEGLHALALETIQPGRPINE
jgi:BolA protein